MPAPLPNSIRMLIIDAYEAGETQDEIAETYRITQSTVSRLIKQYREEGHIFPKKPPGKTPAITQEDYPIVISIVTEHKDITLKQLAVTIAEKLGQPILSEPTICRLLAKLNFTLKKV